MRECDRRISKPSDILESEPEYNCRGMFAEGEDFRLSFSGVSYKSYSLWAGPSGPTIVVFLEEEPRSDSYCFHREFKSVPPEAALEEDAALEEAKTEAGGGPPLENAAAGGPGLEDERAGGSSSSAMVSELYYRVGAALRFVQMGMCCKLFQQSEGGEERQTLCKNCS